jgi:hypothetical protein
VTLNGVLGAEPSPCAMEPYRSCGRSAAENATQLSRGQALPGPQQHDLAFFRCQAGEHSAYRVRRHHTFGHVAAHERLRSELVQQGVVLSLSPRALEQQLAGHSVEPRQLSPPRNVVPAPPGDQIHLVRQVLGRFGSTATTQIPEHLRARLRVETAERLLRCLLRLHHTYL